jgi:hypothetical protein
MVPQPHEALADRVRVDKDLVGIEAEARHDLVFREKPALDVPAKPPNRLEHLRGKSWRQLGKDHRGFSPPVLGTHSLAPLIGEERTVIHRALHSVFNMKKS